ncbi:hypothetical protein AMECASPLE_039540 [Ameca splendens]|uniref:Uncharacterized protein n=1 Tax=Ameca splendens TaxID=208324 RepID=A0ABV0YWI9_9TELE
MTHHVSTSEEIIPSGTAAQHSSSPEVRHRFFSIREELEEQQALTDFFLTFNMLFSVSLYFSFSLLLSPHIINSAFIFRFSAELKFSLCNKRKGLFLSQGDYSVPGQMKAYLHNPV